MHRATTRVNHEASTEVARPCHLERSEGLCTLAVTLSAAKGLPRRAHRCFAALSMITFLSMTTG